MSITEISVVRVENCRVDAQNRVDRVLKEEGPASDLLEAVKIHDDILDSLRTFDGYIVPAVVAEEMANEPIRRSLMAGMLALKQAQKHQITKKTPYGRIIHSAKKCVQRWNHTGGHFPTQREFVRHATRGMQNYSVAA